MEISNCVCGYDIPPEIMELRGEYMKWVQCRKCYCSSPMKYVPSSTNDHTEIIEDWNCMQKALRFRK